MVNLKEMVHLMNGKFERNGTFKWMVNLKKRGTFK